MVSEPVPKKNLKFKLTLPQVVSKNSWFFMCGKANAKWHLQNSHSKLQLEARSVTI